jgi:hypothetical protein
VGGLCLKGQCHEIFFFWFSSRISFPQALIIPLGPFRIFSKIREDIRSSRFAAGVVDTGGQMEKIFNQKNFYDFLWTPLDSRVCI